MNVKVELKETSQALTFEKVINTYTKGSLYVIYVDGKAIKFPMGNIWRITETYS